MDGVQEGIDAAGIKIPDPTVAPLEQIIQLKFDHPWPVPQFHRDRSGMPREEFQAHLHPFLQAFCKIRNDCAGDKTSGNSDGDQFVHQFGRLPSADIFHCDFPAIRSRPFDQVAVQDAEKGRPGIQIDVPEKIQQPDLMTIFRGLVTEDPAIGFYPDEAVFLQFPQNTGNDDLTGSGLLHDRADPRQPGPAGQRQQQFHKILIHPTGIPEVDSRFLSHVWNSFIFR